MIHSAPPINDAFQTDEEWLAQSRGIGVAEERQIGEVKPGTVYRGIVRRRLVVYAGTLVAERETGGVAIITHPRRGETDTPPRFVHAPRAGGGELRIIRVEDGGEVLEMADAHGSLRFSLVTFRFI